MPAVRLLGDELSLDNIDASVAEPAAVGGSVRIAPIHGGTVEITDPVTAVMPDGREKEATGHQPAADSAEKPTLLFRGHMNQGKEGNNGVEGS